VSLILPVIYTYLGHLGLLSDAPFPIALFCFDHLDGCLHGCIANAMTGVLESNI